MVNVLLRYKKFILAVSLGLVILVVSVGCVMFFISQKEDDVTSKDKKTSMNKPLPAPKLATPPKASLPKRCKTYSDAVSQVVGAQRDETGSVVKTENSDLTQCNYYKKDKMVSIKVYKYSDEATAQSDLEKVQVGGYATQQKGKYNVAVSIAGLSGADVDTANKLLQELLEDIE